MGDMKIFPRFDVVSREECAITGQGSPYEIAAAPLENMKNDDLTRPGRLSGNWWPRHSFIVKPVGSGNDLRIDNVAGMCLAGLRFDRNTPLTFPTPSPIQARIRVKSYLYDNIQFLVPTSVTSSSKVTASATEMAKDPDNFSGSGGVWPTYTGTGAEDTSVRVAVTDPTGTVSDANMPGGKHKVLVLVGAGASGGSALTLTVKLYDGASYVKDLGSDSVATTSANSTIAGGGYLFEYDLADEDIGGTWADVQIQVDITASTTYGMCAAVQLVVDTTTGAGEDSGWFNAFPPDLVTNAGAIIDAQTETEFRVQRHLFHLFDSTFHATEVRHIEVSFYDPKLTGSDSLTLFPATNPWSTVDVGRVLLGAAETITGGFRLSGGGTWGSTDASVISRGLGGGVFVEDGARARKHSFLLGGITDAQRRILATYYDAHKGRGKLLAVVPDDSADQDTSFYDAILGVQSQLNPFNVEYQNSTGTYYTRQLDIEELVND